jgi:hypothetical protein
MSERSPATLNDLPEELLEDIFGRLRPEPTRYAIEDYYTKDIEQDPEQEHYRDARSVGLFAICRTSKRFSRIATPLVFAKLDTPDISLMTGLIDTFSKRPELANYVTDIASGNLLHNPCKAIEAKVEEVLRSQLPTVAAEVWNASTAALWVEDLKKEPKKAQLTLLLALTPNLSHLQLGTYNGTLQKVLGLDFAANIPGFHGYKKLERLDIGTEPKRILEPESYSQCISTFRHLPALRHYRCLYLRKVGGSRVEMTGHGLQNLQTLHLCDVRLSIQEITKSVWFCKSLKEFRFRALGPYHFFTHYFDDLCCALAQSKDSLEYLCVQFGRGLLNSRLAWEGYTPARGVFKQFLNLRTLLVPVIALLGAPTYDPLQGLEATWQHFKFNEDISECLPVSLSFLGLEDTNARFSAKRVQRNLVVDAVHQLGRGLHKLPNLQAVYLLDPDLRQNQAVYLSTSQIRQNNEDDFERVQDEWDGTRVDLIQPVRNDRLMLLRHHGQAG